MLLPDSGSAGASGGGEVRQRSSQIRAGAEWGTLSVGDRLMPWSMRSRDYMRNHTATHLLHAGLREILGKHVKQAGSLVAPDHLRFDFSHFTAVEDEELQDIEDIINKELLRNIKVETLTMCRSTWPSTSIMRWRCLARSMATRCGWCKIGDFSTELCGGTHTAATGEIGLIKILKEGSVSSGVRRVEAVTGEGSLGHFRKDHELENVVSAFVAPTLSQKARKDGAPTSDLATDNETSLSPADALKAELEKKDERDQAADAGTGSGADEIGFVFDGEYCRRRSGK